VDLAEHVVAVPLLLASVVWGIEWLGHKLHKPWSFELGVPIGGKREVLEGAIPSPIPEHWVADFNVETISGSRLTFTPLLDDNEAPTCFGVLSLHANGGRTDAHYMRRASFGPLAFSAAVVASARLAGQDLPTALVFGAVVAAVWAFKVWRQTSRLDESYEMLSSALSRSAVESHPI
jgi:hypothetical protein